MKNSVSGEFLSVICAFYLGLAALQAYHRLCFMICSRMQTADMKPIFPCSPPMPAWPQCNHKGTTIAPLITVRKKKTTVALNPADR